VASRPVLTDTIERYLAQIAVSMRPQTVTSLASGLGLFAAFVSEHHPEVMGAVDIRRPHIESYKTWMAAGRVGASKPLAPNTIRQRLSILRMFFERIIEWDWEDAPPRCPIFSGDSPKKDEPLPKFLDDPTFARFMRVAVELPLHRRLPVELLARTGMRVGELCALRDDAVFMTGEHHWLRVPVGKLHNDRCLPLHGELIELLAQWDQVRPDNGSRLLLANDWGWPLNRHAVARILNTITRQAGIGHVHPHQLRHTLATQCINNGMSLEAIAALLGHRRLDMTMVYARIGDRVVADEYFAVTKKVEALYNQPRRLAAEDEGPNMARLRKEHHRLLGNGWCTRPVELDCAFETICEGCGYFATTVQFRPTLRRQRDDARRKHQTGRAEIYDKLLTQLDDNSNIHP
jgi:site-specific recombinase XerD